MIGAMADAALPPITLSAPPAAGEAVLEGDIVLNIAGEAVALHLEVPAAPTTLDALMPVFQGLTNEVARRATARAEAEGAQISCRAGCGACCRQAVPVAEVEARRLAALVAAMPEPRRSQIKARFDDAQRRLEQAGLAGRMLDMPDRETTIDLGAKYFRLGVACPFLEAESCSIHPDRPLRCREYFVTSPPAACAEIDPDTIKAVRLAGTPSTALYGAGARDAPKGWVLLIDALSFAERFPTPSAARPAPDWMAEVVGRLA